MATKSVTRIATICSGNICRSPMAEYILKQTTTSLPTPPRIVSMGTLGIIGRPPSKNAIRAMEDIDIDISGHRSQGLSNAILQAADYLLVMEPIHQQIILQRLPALEPHIHMLGAWDPDSPGETIEDPVNQSIAVFRQIRAQLQRAISNFTQQRLS